MSKKNRDARREPVAHLPVKTVTLPAEIETVSISVGVTAPTPPQDEPAPVAAPLTLRERALAAGAIVEAAMARYGHRYPFRLVERVRGDDITFGTPGAPAALVEMVRREMAVAMPEVMVEGKRRNPQ